MHAEWLGPARSLRRFQVRTSLLYVLLILFSGVLGLVGSRPWEHLAGEVSRLSAIETEVYLIRGTLYRQVKEVFDDLLLGDPLAREEHAEYTRRIVAAFDQLEPQLRGAQEQGLVRRLRESYGEVERISATLMRNAHAGGPISVPPGEPNTDALGWLHTEIESGAFQRFEDHLARFEALVQQSHRRQTDALAALTRVAPWLLAFTLLGAGLLMAQSSIHLRREFARPLARVLEATARIRQGELGHRVPLQGVAELEGLAVSINGMAAELAASRQALVQSERQAALAALIPVVAHNIRNPLASIRATAQIADAPELPAETREALADIIGASDRLAAWTHSLLSYLHPLQPQWAMLSLPRLADQALALHAGLLESRGLRVEREGWSDEAALQGDAHLLEQAISALIVNAAEASPPGGLITLALRAEPEGWCLGVRDRGPGWSGPPALQGLTPLRSSKPGGSGLGLPFCAKVCDSHGGRLDYRSPDGGGTEACLHLPRDGRVAPLMPGQEAEPAPPPASALSSPAAFLARGRAGRRPAPPAS